jgi:hypothetical protein
MTKLGLPDQIEQALSTINSHLKRCSVAAPAWFLLHNPPASSAAHIYWWIKEWKVKRPVDALKLTQASGIPVEIGLRFSPGTLPRVPLSIEEPVETHMVNVIGMLNAFIAARDAGVARLVYSGSGRFVPFPAGRVFRRFAQREDGPPYSSTHRRRRRLGDGALCVARQCS